MIRNTPLSPASFFRSWSLGWLMVAGVAGSVFGADAPKSADAKPVTTETAIRAAAPAAARPANRAIDDLNLELVWIEPGSFLMGSPPDEADRNKAEGPQFQVTLTKGFWLGKTEMTQAQYEAVTGTNPSFFQEVGKTAPVERVSWLDAMEFCRTLTERERTAGRLPQGYAYSLPTEAQWEYACRAGSTTAYVGEPSRIAWYDRNSGGKTHPVETTAANAWGLQGMTGNIIEWCLDWYGDYPRDAVTDPSGPRTGYFRMARGGGWRSRPDACRSAARSGGSPGRRDYTLGFRLALSAVR